jgi:hypothetical protein
MQQRYAEVTQEPCRSTATEKNNEFGALPHVCAPENPTFPSNGKVLGDTARSPRTFPTVSQDSAAATEVSIEVFTTAESTRNLTATTKYNSNNSLCEKG